MLFEKNNFSHLARNPDKKDFMTCATVSITAISGQNSYPPPYYIIKLNRYKLIQIQFIYTVYHLKTISLFG